MPSDIVQLTTQWIQLHPVWAGVVVFGVSMLESLAIVGVLVPGVAIMFAIGALIGAGDLPLVPTLLWAMLGTSLGDGLSFALGWHFKDRLYRLDYFQRHDKLLDRGHRFFAKYGLFSVLIGRFVGPIRAIVPLVAGMMEMPVPRYLAANVVASALWAPVYLAPGLLFGQSYEIIFHWLEQWWYVVVLAILFGVLAYQGLRRYNIPEEPNNADPEQSERDTK